jgi:hypothetical protein
MQTLKKLPKANPNKATKIEKNIKKKLGFEQNPSYQYPSLFYTGTHGKA